MSQLTDLRNAFQEALHSPHSSFYRDFYKGKIELGPEFPKTREEWETLPVLTKADIAKVPFHKRIYLPGAPGRIRTTSGTTQSGVLISPRAPHPWRPDVCTRLGNISSFMGFYYPSNVYDSLGRPDIRYTQGDMGRLEISAALAADAQVDCLSGFPSLLIAFGPLLAKVYDTSRIKSLYCWGETCTVLQREALKKQYPKAYVVVNYSSSEGQGVPALTPSPEVEGYPNALVTSGDFDMEFLDEKDAPVQTLYTPAELIVSVIMEHMAFPLFRYRTGDKAMLLSREGPVFTLLGRTEGDRVRFGAGVFIREEVERAVAAASGGQVTDFEASVTEIPVGGKIIPRLSVTVVVPEGTAVDTDALAKNIEKELSVTERRTYYDAVVQGICAPLVCTAAPLTHNIGRKRTRLIDAR